MCRRIPTHEYTPCQTCGEPVQSAERIVLDCDYVPPTPEGTKAVVAAEDVINSTTSITTSSSSSSRRDKPVAAADPNQQGPISPLPFCLPPLSCPVAGPVEKWPLEPPHHYTYPDPAVRTANCCSPCQRLLAAWHRQGLRCAAYDARGFFVFDVDMLERRDQIRSVFMVERGLLSLHYLLTGCMARQLGATTNRFFNPGWEMDDGATPIVPATTAAAGNAAGNAAAPPRLPPATATAADGNLNSIAPPIRLPAISTYSAVDDGAHCEILRQRLDGVLREFARLGRLEQARGTRAVPAHR